MGCLFVDDLNLDASRDLRMSDQLGDQNLVASHVNRNYVRPDLKTDVSSDENHGHRTNDRLDDPNLGDDHRDAQVCHRMNETDDRNDLKMDGSLAVNRGHRTNGLLVGHLKDGDHHDVLVGHSMDVSSDENRDLHTNEMGDRNDLSLVVLTDVSLCLRMSDLLDDLKMNANLGVMSHRVMSMVYLNTSCDRMSHAHLRCDHLKMHHRDTNRMDAMNLDGKILDVMILVGNLTNPGAMNSNARMI
jgi:hypothetical protein